MPREGPRAGRPPCSTRLGKGEPVASATTTTTPSTRSEEARRKAPSASPHRPCRAGRPTAVRDASSARRDPPPTRRGEARAAVGQGSGRRSGTAPPRGLERRTRRLPVVGAQRRKEGRRTQRGGELRHPQRQHRPNAPSRIAREGFLRRGGVAPETPRRAIPDGLPPTGGKGTTRNSGGLRYGSQRDARASAARSVCAEPAGGPAVPPSRQLGHRPPPARTEGRLSPPTRRRGKRRRGSGALSLRDPGQPEGTPPTQRHPPLSLTRPQRRGTMLAACGHALGAGHRGTVARRPHHRQSLTASTPHPSHPRGETTTKRRAGARIRPARRAQSDHTGKHSARGREATPPARPRAPDGRPGALQGHHRRPGGSATRAQRRAAPPTPPPRGRGGRFEKTTTRGLSAASEGPRPQTRSESERGRAGFRTPAPTHDTPGAGRSEGPAGRARRSVPFAMNVRPSSGAA